MNLEEAYAGLINQGFVKRQTQYEMAQQVAGALKDHQIAVIEGGTGIGKSFGYLLPALLSLPEDKTLVVATATVNLQHQLLTKDLPVIAKILGRPVQAEIAKGRRRYVCAQRLAQAADGNVQQDELALFGIQAPATGKQQQKVLARLAQQYQTQKWDGDRDSLTEQVEDSTWRQVTTDAAGCSNRKCGFFQQCAYFQAKRRLQAARVIITNQDLLLTDIAFGTGFVLPKAESCLYVIDEAHHLAAKAVQHFTGTCALLGQMDWLERVGNSVVQLQTLMTLPADQVEKVVQHSEELKQQLKQMYEVVMTNFPDKKEEWLIAQPPEALQSLAKTIEHHAQILHTALGTIRRALVETQDSRTLPDFERYLAVLSVYLQRAENVLYTWRLFCQDNDADTTPIARWFTRSEPRGGVQDVLASAALISAAATLQQRFWEQAQGVVLCSATLCALGKFDAFLQKVGLSDDKRVTTARYLSPFDYQQSQLVIPAMPALPGGATNPKFEQAVIAYLPSVLAAEQQGCLVLFTSRYMMLQAFDAMPAEVQENILLQDNYPKQKILQRHKARVDEGSPSIIFGLQSFAEGVDLPGDYCRHLIITKLPFAVPTTPIEQRYADWLAQQGHNPFIAHSLPEASLRLTQYVGRLVRTESDVGKVTILDRRLVDKPYGRQMLDSLPPFRCEIESVASPVKASC